MTAALEIGIGSQPFNFQNPNYSAVSAQIGKDDMLPFESSYHRFKLDSADRLVLLGPLGPRGRPNIVLILILLFLYFMECLGLVLLLASNVQVLRDGQVWVDLEHRVYPGTWASLLDLRHILCSLHFTADPWESLFDIKRRSIVTFLTATSNFSNQK